MIIEKISLKIKLENLRKREKHKNFKIFKNREIKFQKKTNKLFIIFNEIQYISKILHIH